MVNEMGGKAQIKKVSALVIFDNILIFFSLQIRYFTLHSTKYYWNDEVQNFEVLT